MTERIPTVEDILLVLTTVGYTDAEAAEGIERIKKRGVGIGHLAAQENMQASIGAAFREAKAEAWDEGREAFEAAHRWDNAEPWQHLTANPYREEAGL